MIDRNLLKDEALQLGIALDAEMLEKLDSYAALLVEKNRVMNLTAITDPVEILYKHFVDSLIVPAAYRIPDKAKVIDIGTGAGFPGMVMLITRPDLAVTFLDSTEKKLVFISETAEKLGLECSFLNARAEDAGKDTSFRESFDAATARAVAELRILTELALPFIKVGGVFLPMKSRLLESELSECGNTVELLGGKKETVSVYNIKNCGERAIAVIRKVKPTEKKYPRAYAQIKKRPL